MKKPFILLLLVCFPVVMQRTVAYNDHRNARVDSLEAALKSQNPPMGNNLLRAYDELMRGYLPYDAGKASHYGRLALALSYKLNALNVRQNVLRNFAMMHYGREEFSQAISLYHHALDVVDSMAAMKRYTQKDIDDARSAIYGNLGNVYNLQDKDHLAISCYQKALQIFEKYGWLESQAILYNNIGELYASMGNEDEAMRNYLLSVQRGEASGDSLMTAIPSKGLIDLYIRQGNYDQARQTAERCYAYYHAHRDEEADYALVLAAMVRLNLMDGHQDLTAAEAYAREALGFSDRLAVENQYNIQAACCQLAVAKGQWNEALCYGLKSIHPDSLATRADADSYRLLARIYSELGQKDMTRAYMNKVYDMMSRYATDHYQSGLSQMEALYETEKKEAAIRQLTREKRWLQWGSLLALTVVLLTALISWLWWRSVRLRRKHALATAKLEGELAERVRLSRDLHDRLGGLLTAVKLSVPEGSTAARLTDEAITEMRNVSHHLLPDALRRNGLRTALRDYCQTLKNVSFTFVGDEKHIRHAETIYCIVYELVNNAIKSAQAHHIRVQLMAGKDFTAVNVSDDGNGLATEEAGGKGLQNIRERVEALKGKFELNAQQGAGTEINIELRNND